MALALKFAFGLVDNINLLLIKSINEAVAERVVDLCHVSLFSE